MSSIEAEPSYEIKTPAQEIVSFNGPLRDSQSAIDYPYLDAWLKVSTEGLEFAFPAKIVASRCKHDDKAEERYTEREEIYEQGNVEAAKKIAGAFALSLPTVLDKLGLGMESFESSFGERLEELVELAQYPEADYRDRNFYAQQNAQYFIEQAMDFVSLFDPKQFDHLHYYLLRSYIGRQLIQKRPIVDISDAILRAELISQAVSVLKDDKKPFFNNNLSLSGGLALYGLALPKKNFVDSKIVRTSLVEQVKQDSVAWSIFKSLNTVLFDGKRIEPGDEMIELQGGEQSFPVENRTSVFGSFGLSEGSGEKELKPKEKSQLEIMTDEFLASHK